MTNKINRCPRCKANSIIDGHYLYIRDEFILFDGKCVNCGYEVEAEYPYEQIIKKFDIEKDLEYLEKPLEALLDRVKSTEEETRKRILDCLIKLYEEKAKKSYNDEEVEKCLCKMVNCKQVLAGRKYSDAEIFSEYGQYYSSLHSPKKAIEWYEKAIESDPDNGLVHFLLSFLYERTKDFDKAIEHLDIIHDRKEENIAPSEELKNYLVMHHSLRKGELLFKKGEYEKAIDLLQQVSFTPEMFEKDRAEKISIGGIEVVDVPSYWARLYNMEARQFMLVAFVSLEDLDRGLQVYNEWLRIVSLNAERNYNQLDFNYDEDFRFFCNVISVLLKKDVEKAFKYVQEAELINCDDPAVEFLVDFLKGNIYLKHVLCPQRENKERKELLEKANEYFESVDTVLEWYGFGSDVGDFFCNNWEGARYIWETVFGSVERILPESHKNRGIILEELDKPEEAFVQYKKAIEYKDYQADEDLKRKTENVKLKISPNKVKELQKSIAELHKDLMISASSGVEKDSLGRIKSLLNSVRDDFPKDIEELEAKMNGRPYERLPKCREIIEGYWEKVWKNEEKKCPDLSDKFDDWRRMKFRSEKYNRDEKLAFAPSVDFLEKEGIINAFVKQLLYLVWYSGSGGVHARKDRYRYVRTLKTEDVEVVIGATIRFLSWYQENYVK